MGSGGGRWSGGWTFGWLIPGRKIDPGDNSDHATTLMHAKRSMASGASEANVLAAEQVAGPRCGGAGVAGEKVRQETVGRMKTMSLPMRCLPAALIGISLTAGALGWGSGVFAQGGRHVKSSMLLLIDASGSMGDPIGSGNPQVKIEAAKQAAIATLGRAANSGSVEVAILAFSGDCQNPVPRYQDFTRDVGRLTQFIGSLQPGGGTPMAEALLFANRYMHGKGDPSAATRAPPFFWRRRERVLPKGDAGPISRPDRTGVSVFRLRTKAKSTSSAQWRSF